MFMRRRPLLRAAAIGGGAYLVGKKAGQRQGDQQEDQAGQSGGSQSGQYGGSGGQGGQPRAQAAPPQAEAAPPSAAASIPDQLNRLSALHDQGALTDAEFASAKAKLLGT